MRFIAFASLFVSLMATTAMYVGPSVELFLNPIRSNQTITVTERTDKRICWMWSSEKDRVVVSDNMDVYLETGDGDSASMSIYERDTGYPWAKSRAVAPGHHDQAYCLDLPPYVSPNTTLKIEQTADYPGIMNLWKLHVHLPTITSDKIV